MSLTAVTKIYRFQNKAVIYIPKDIVSDSQFPFTTSTEVVIKIKEGKLVVEGL